MSGRPVILTALFLGKPPGGSLPDIKYVGSISIYVSLCDSLLNYSIFSLPLSVGSNRVTDEALIAETAVRPIFSFINVITVLKRTQF